MVEYIHKAFLKSLKHVKSLGSFGWSQFLQKSVYFYLRDSLSLYLWIFFSRKGMFYYMFKMSWDMVCPELELGYIVWVQMDIDTLAWALTSVMYLLHPDFKSFVRCFVWF